MIITQTPFRISFFGGGTDYPAWYRKHGGETLAATIDKYCYLRLRVRGPYFEQKHRLVYSKIEMVSDVSEISHPAVKGILGQYPPRCGLEIHHDGDLPARAGLGSSSAFTVGLIHALRAFDRRTISKNMLANEALRIEQDVIGENVGSQDQIATAYGGLNRIKFRRDGSYEVVPLEISAERLRAFTGNLMLYFTGFQRNGADVAREQIANVGRNEGLLTELKCMPGEGASILCDPSRSLSALGELLHHSWGLKRALAEGITTPEIDLLYERARAAGAIGGKLLGAGGGGFMIFYVEPARQAEVRAALPGIHVPFQFEFQGSRLLVGESDARDSVAAPTQSNLLDR